MWNRHNVEGILKIIVLYLVRVIFQKNYFEKSKSFQICWISLRSGLFYVCFKSAPISYCFFIRTQMNLLKISRRYTFHNSLIRLKSNMSFVIFPLACKQCDWSFISACVGIETESLSRRGVYTATIVVFTSLINNTFGRLYTTCDIPVYSASDDGIGNSR